MSHRKYKYLLFVLSALCCLTLFAGLSYAQETKKSQKAESKTQGDYAVKVSAEDFKGAFFARSDGKGTVQLLWLPPVDKWPEGGWRLEDVQNGTIIKSPVILDETEYTGKLSAKKAKSLSKFKESVDQEKDPNRKKLLVTFMVAGAISDWDFARALGLAYEANELPSGKRSFRAVGLDSSGKETGLVLISPTINPEIAGPLPAPPGNLRAESTKEGVSLFWAPPTDEQQPTLFTYHIERKNPDMKIVSLSEEPIFKGKKLREQAPGFIDRNAPTENEVTYFVYCMDPFGVKSEPASAKIFVPDLNALLPPSKVTAEAGDGKVIIKWEPGNNPHTTGYVVERSYLVDGIYEVLTPKGLGTDIKRFEDKSERGGTYYYYRLRAVGPRGDLGEPSLITTAMARSKDKPSNPAGLKAEVGRTRVRLTWKETAEPIAGYFIERRVEGAKKWLRINTTLHQGLRYDDDHAPAGYGTFSYRVVAVSHDYKESDPSGEVTATIEDRSFPPVPLITDIDGKEGKVAVTFQPGVPEEKSHQFLIVRAVSVDDPGLVIGDPLPGKLRTFVDTFVKPGQFYWYRVVALDKKGNRSDLSSPVVVRVGSPPIPIPKKPEVKFLKEPFQRVEIKFERPPKGLFITIQHRTEGKDTWLTITRALTIDYALHTSLPEKGKVEYRIVYQAENGEQGEPSEPVEISIP